MFWFNRLKLYITRFIKPSMYISGMDYVFKLWQDADTKERVILLLTFSPMFISMLGLILTIIYFVLFVLPSYLFKILGCGILTALFGSGGRYCFKYFTGLEIKDKNIIDVNFSDEAASEEQTTRKRVNRKKANE